MSALARRFSKLLVVGMAASAGLSFLTFTGAASAEPASVPLDPAGTLKIDAQYRPRVLVTSGRDFTGTHDAREYVTQRARLGLSLAGESGLAFTVRLQDVRIWGEEGNTLNDYSADGFDAHEVFVLIPAAKWLKFKVGRQELVLDNSRLVGNVGWTQRARSFDGVRATLNLKPLRVDMFYTKISEAEAYPDGHVPPGREDDVDFGGVHTTVKFAKTHALSSLYLVNANHGYNPAGDEHLRHTAGLFAKGAVGGFGYQAEGYYQFGRMSDKKIAAYMAAGRIGYKLKVPGKPFGWLWAEYLSGDGSPTGTFDTMYATNHKFYGEMDFFLNVPKNTANLGIVDVGGRLGAAPAKPLKLHLDLHHLRSVEATPTGEHVFGNELDFKVSFKLMKNVAMRALYGVFLPGEAIRASHKKIGPDTGLKAEHLGYLTLDVKL